MRPFRATYTPVSIEAGRFGEPCEVPFKSAAQAVVVLHITSKEEQPATAVFINSHGALQEAPITRITNCQLTEWVMATTPEVPQ